MKYLEDFNETDEGKINIRNPDTCDIRKIMESKCINIVCNGPGSNNHAVIRLMKILDSIEDIDKHDT